MTMSNNWQESYKALQSFALNTPGIIITDENTTIAADVRIDFYRLFDMVRQIFIEEKFKFEIEQSTILSQNYKMATQTLMESLKLKEVIPTNETLALLTNPLQGLMKFVYNCLFDLLKGRLDTHSFESQAIKTVKGKYAQIYAIGYEQWVTVSAINLIEPAVIYNTSLDFSSDSLPHLIHEESQTFSLKQRAAHPKFRIPDAVLFSPKLQSYVVLKLELGRVLPAYNCYGLGKFTGSKYFEYSGIGTGRRALLMYLVKNIEEAPVIANTDTSHLSPPDILIECISSALNESLDIPDELTKHIQTLNPALGAFLVTQQPLAASYSNLLPENVKVIEAGFNPGKLKPIADMLTLPPKAVIL